MTQPKPPKVKFFHGELTSDSAPLEKALSDFLATVELLEIDHSHFTDKYGETSVMVVYREKE